MTASAPCHGATNAWSPLVAVAIRVAARTAPRLSIYHLEAGVVRGRCAGSHESTLVLTSTQMWNSLSFMNAQELKRLLAAKGCKFETHRGGSGHLTIRRGDRRSQLPMHGRHKELGTGLVNKILKDLGLK